MAEYKHGSMDIKDHEQTFHGTIKAARFVIILSICILLFAAFVNG